VSGPSAQVPVQQDVRKSSVGEGSAKKQQANDPKEAAVEEVIMMPPKSSVGRGADENVEVLSARPMVRTEKVDVLDLLRAGIDRVQGLSGADINESEDDMVSKEVQQSQTKEGTHTEPQLDMVLLKCANPAPKKSSVVLQELEKGTIERGHYMMDEVARNGKEDQQVKDRQKTEAP
jgi:hypothetical protein